MPTSKAHTGAPLDNGFTVKLVKSGEVLHSIVPVNNVVVVVVTVVVVVVVVTVVVVVVAVVVVVTDVVVVVAVAVVVVVVDVTSQPWNTPPSMPRYASTMLFSWVTAPVQSGDATTSTEPKHSSGDASAPPGPLNSVEASDRMRAASTHASLLSAMNRSVSSRAEPQLSWTVGGSSNSSGRSPWHELHCDTELQHDEPSPKHPVHNVDRKLHVCSLH